ncbi:hypothetical protein Patl1_35124 [Pistacia atlantica]|uniref:Uncharacterized protein n=1 Tax=Pistacia atlantica TaxID=434234 RepID=A0ACC0ZQM7_9ROSI|nr:hypothetical protein Patl1_35124 [Pistacia atlantica]
MIHTYSAQTIFPAGRHGSLILRGTSRKK